MIDINQINLAVKVSTEEHYRQNGVKEAYGIHGVIELNTWIFDGILELSERYLRDSISDPSMLKESLGYLRRSLMMNEYIVKRDSVIEFMRHSGELN